MRNLRHLAFALCLALALPASALAAKAAKAPGPSFAKRADVQAFIADMVERHGFVKKEMEFLFSRARHQPAVIKAIKPGAPGVRSWQAYRSRFINPVRIDGGVAFWERHQAALERAEQTYGVPARIIAAIIGVETVYGRNKGGFRVIDALATLAFDYPPRADFFRSELEQYLLLARESGRDVFSVKGSYAGAIGIPQFMPGSYRRYGVDFDRSGGTDLRDSAEDAIGSVANFLRAHGWEPGRPIAVAASVEGAAWRSLAAAELKPSARPADLKGLGIGTAAPVPDDALLALIELETPDAPSEYLAAMHNFWVITRYNRSSFYAAAVLELADAIEAARQPRR